MNTHKRLNIIILLILIIGLTGYSYSIYKTGGNYEINTDIISSGGNDYTSGGNYINNSSLVCFSTFYNLIDSTQVVTGYLPNINNLPLVLLTTPYNYVLFDYNNGILFKWQYSDFDNNTQTKYQVVLSTTSDFTGNNYGSAEVISSTDQWQSGLLPDSTYYWKVRACDNNWYEWNSSTYVCVFSVDTSSPTVTIVNWDVYTSSITVYSSASDAVIGLHLQPYKFHISTSSNFETNITTTTSWREQSSYTFEGLVHETTSYYIKVEARDKFLHISSTWNTILVLPPEIYVVNTTTYSLSIGIDPTGFSPYTQYAIKDIIGQTTYYVWPDGNLLAGSSWAVYSVWTDTIVVKDDEISPNQKHNFYLGVKTSIGETLYDFNIWVSTYTLSEKPEISLFDVHTDSVSIVINPKNNPGWTEYCVKCIVDGTTYYLQSDHGLDFSPVWQTSSTWGQNKCYVIVSTPNFPVDIYVKSRNVLGAETEYSNLVSTWTALVAPEPPTVIGCYENIQLEGQSEPSWQYFTRIFINSRNSGYTQYAILSIGVSKYLNGSGGLSESKFWNSASSWHSGYTNIHNQGIYFGPGQTYTYKITAISVARQEGTEESPLGSATTPSESFPISTQELNDDAIRITWSPVNSQTGVTRYDIYRAPYGSEYSFVTSVSTSVSQFDYEIDGGQPSAPENINTKLHGNSIIISWQKVANPESSLSYSYQVKAVSEVQGSTYTIISSPGSQFTSVTPIIEGYGVYCLTNNTTYYTTSTEITIENLELYKTHHFRIFAISSDDLESESTPVEVYLSYPGGPLQLGTNISGSFRHNGSFIGVPKAPEITIEFNKVVDTTTITQDRIYIRATRDNKNRNLDETIKVPLTISSFDNISVVSLKPYLNYGYKYQIIISSASDLTGQNISAIYEFETLYDFNIDNIIVPNTTTYIEISNPTQTLDDKLYFIVNENLQTTEITKANKKLPDEKLIITTFELSPNNEQQAKIKEFKKYLDITIGYNDKNNDGFVDEDIPKIKVDTLSIWHLDQERSSWMKLPTTIDKVRKILTAKVKHFSIFAIIGALNYSVSDVKCYPVPWIPEDGKYATGTLQDGIKFINLPVEGEIFIYTITGELVKKIEFDQNYEGTVTWLGDNQAGNEVASGVYLWMVKSKENKKTGKLIVIR